MPLPGVSSSPFVPRTTTSSSRGDRTGSSSSTRSSWPAASLATWYVATPALAQSSGALAVSVRGVDSGEVLNAIFDGQLERVRLIGVDVPGCMDLEARQRLDGLARGRVAFLELDDLERDVQG